MRNDLIISINNLFDENANLKARNEYLENYFKEHEKPHKMTGYKSDINPIDLKIIKYGKQQLCEKVLKSWNSNVSVYRDENTKELIVTKYDKWLKDKIYRDYIPEDMSSEEVINAIYDYAMEMYEEEKVKAIKRFEEKELKKGSEEDE